MLRIVLRADWFRRSAIVEGLGFCIRFGETNRRHRSRCLAHFSSVHSRILLRLDPKRLRNGHTLSFERRTGKPIKGKYEMGSTVEQKYFDKSYRVVEDTDSFAQEKTGFLNATTKTSAGFAVADG